MQKKILYVCEKCGTEYKDEKIANDCEKAHVAPKKIKSARYVGYKNDKTGLPSSIVVLMENGQEVTFKRS